MQKRDCVLWAVVASIFVFLPLSIILPDVNEATTISIATVAAGVVILIFKQYFFADIPYSEKKDHTEKICEVFLLLICVGIAQGRHNASPWKYFLKFPTKSKSRDQIIEEMLEDVRVEQIYEDQLDRPAYLYYDRALEHLEKYKKYKHIYKHWENTKTLLDKLNDKTSFEERLEGAIKEKMHLHFPALKSSTSVVESSDHYNPYNIMQFMMKCFSNRDNFSKDALNSLTCMKSTRDKFVCSYQNSNDRHITVNSNSEIDLETYKKFIKEMQEDDSLNDFYNEYADKYDNIRKELTYFKDELEKLVKDLKTGKLIEGKCNVGY